VAGEDSEWDTREGGGMTIQMYRRLEKLSAKLRPNGIRQFTLEELCRLYWRKDKRGFKRMTEESPMYQVFVEIFEREDAEREEKRLRTDTPKRPLCAPKRAGNPMKSKRSGAAPKRRKS
jgi:hypothetical protein